MSQAPKSAIIAVLAERRSGERRVALAPREVEKLAMKAAVRIECGAGVEAGFTDEAYRAAGASVADRATILSGAQLVIAVRPPAELDGIAQGSSLISLGAHDAELLRSLMDQGVNHLALERLPRITRAQSMDVLSSQATIAGYAAVIAGAQLLDTLLPMMTTAAGIVKPAKMIALGAGVAGLQAIATARRLGAVVYGFDVRAAAGEQVASLGARFVSPQVEMEGAEAGGGYAGAQSSARQEALRRALTPTLADMQLVVTSAQIPGRPAPLLIDDETLAAMAPGSVIVDLAAETGGNTTRSLADTTVSVGGVRILGSTHLTSGVATDASRLFSSNIHALVEHLLDAEGRLQLAPNDEITAALLGAPPIQRAA